MIGVNNQFFGSIVVSGIVKFCKLYNADTPIDNSNTSTALIMKVSPGIQNNTEYIFDDKIRQTVGMCNNYQGRRSISWCAHLCTAVLFYRHTVMNTPIKQPTPKMYTQYNTILNVSNYIHKIAQQSEPELIEYLGNIFMSDEYNNDFEGHDIMSLRN